MYEKNCNLRTLSHEYDCLAKIGIKHLRKHSHCYWETRSNVNMRRLELTIKDKI